MSLITDKITIPTETPPASRPRLLQALADSMACCNATVISGRAGTGKTMLAADFAARSGRGTAWYKVDAPEIDLHLFLQYLIAAVRTRHAGFGRKTLALVQAKGYRPEDSPLWAESFIYELLLLEAGEPLLIIVDDLHLVYDAEWVVPFFSRLLPLLPAEVHLVLLGRSLPPAPLWRMRSKQTLRVIEEPALLFDAREADALFAGYGHAPELAAAALAETRGRAAGLDGLARTQGEALKLNEGARGLMAGRGEERTNAARLQLVKGLTPKASLRAN